MHNRLFGLTILMVCAVGFYVITYAHIVIADVAEYDAAVSLRITNVFRERKHPIIAKGLYLTASSANSTAKRADILKLLQETELNSVVIDIKDYTGHILYDSNVPLVNELDTDRETLKNIRAVVKEFKDAGIYVIARQTVFQDPALATAKPEWAIRTDGGGVWHDYKGLSWVDPTLEEVWNYNMDIAREAAKLGFDELNFDYVRFPSDGPINAARYANLAGSKPETMNAFFKYLQTRLSDAHVFTSLDLFGLVLELHDFDMNIGQRLDVALGLVDYIYPMTYPSHYPDGYLGFANPADHPYDVVNNGLTKAHVVVNGSKTKLRPWIQAFDLGAVYDGAKIRAQIKATEESGLTAGWMLWNAANRYSASGLHADES